MANKVTMYEIVTLGRSIHKNGPFYERNNAKYNIVKEKPNYPVGYKTIIGDYEVEIIYIQPLEVED